MDEVVALLKSGLPWYATVLMLVGGVYVGRWIDSWIKLRTQRMAERQYEDGQTREGYQALVAELKNRIEKLERIVDKQAEKLEATAAALAKCEVEHADRRGEIAVLQTEVERLKAHDKANKDQLEVLKEDLGKA